MSGNEITTIQAQTLKRLQREPYVYRVAKLLEDQLVNGTVNCDELRAMCELVIINYEEVHI